MSKLKPLLYLALLSFMGGSVSTFTKLALRDVPPLGFIWMRLAVGFVIGYFMVRAIGQRVSWAKVKAFGPVAVFWWLNALLFPLGLTMTDATTAQFIRISAPILTALIAGFMLDKSLNSRQWLGTAVAAAGVILVTFDGGQLSLSQNHWLGNTIIFLANAVFAYYAVASKLPRFTHIHPFEMVLIGAGSGTLATLPVAAWEYSRYPWLGQISAGAWGFMLAACIIISLFYCGFQVLVHRYGPTYATLDLYLLPCFVVLWASALLGERLTWTSSLGALIALGGVWLVTTSTRPAPPTTPLEAAE